MEQENDGRRGFACGAIEDPNPIGLDPLDGCRRNAELLLARMRTFPRCLLALRRAFCSSSWHLVTHGFLLLAPLGSGGRPRRCGPAIDSILVTNPSSLQNSYPFASSKLERVGGGRAADPAAFLVKGVPCRVETWQAQARRLARAPRWLHHRASDVNRYANLR